MMGKGIVDDGEEINWTGLANHGVIVVVLGLFGLYRYVRSFIYPCITPFELEEASKVLDDTHQAVPRDLREWNDIENDYLSIKIQASQIREKSLQGSTWKTYLGFRPELMYDIAQCYTKYEELKCRILTAHERNLQSHLGAEQYRRQIATRPSPQIQTFTSAYESPFRSQSEGHSPRPYSAEV